MTRKTQKKLRKLLTLVCCAVMLVCVSVGATIAYLTDDDKVVNTFTVGNVDIALDEANVNVNGQPVDNNDNVVEKNKAPRVTENEYKLMPGHSYVKDPTVTVQEDSEVAYVRMKVTVTNHDALYSAICDENDPTTTAEYSYTVGNKNFVKLQALVTGWEQSKWPCKSITANTDGSVTYEFWYYQKTGAGKLEPLFETIKLPGNVDNAELPTLEDTEVTVVAEAIQADGFATADAAWAAWTAPVATPTPAPTTGA